MAAEQRKLLEQLMGREALSSHVSNSHSGGPGRKDMRGRSDYTQINLHDPKICKAFLVGDCLHDLFKGTKHDLGRCPRKHLESYRMEFQHQLSLGKKFPEFYESYERTLADFIRESDKNMVSEKAILERTDEDEVKINEVSKSIETLSSKINLGLEEIELLGQHGELARALYEADKIEQIRLEREERQKELRAISETSGFSGRQKLQVCSTCGSFLSRIDNDKRLADHFLGKLHQGYRQARENYAKVKEMNGH